MRLGSTGGFTHASYAREGAVMLDEAWARSAAHELGRADKVGSTAFACSTSDLQSVRKGMAMVLSEPFLFTSSWMWRSRSAGRTGLVTKTTGLRESLLW